MLSSIETIRKIIEKEFFNNFEALSKNNFNKRSSF